MSCKEIKTKKYPQHCPNVRKHFENAQKWTKSIESLDIQVWGNEISNVDELVFNC